MEYLKRHQRKRMSFLAPGSRTPWRYVLTIQIKTFGRSTAKTVIKHSHEGTLFPIHIRRSGLTGRMPTPEGVKGIVRLLSRLLKRSPVTRTRFL